MVTRRDTRDILPGAPEVAFNFARARDRVDPTVGMPPGTRVTTSYGSRTGVKSLKPVSQSPLNLGLIRLNHHGHFLQNVGPVTTFYTTHSSHQVPQARIFFSKQAPTPYLEFIKDVGSNARIPNNVLRGRFFPQFQERDIRVWFLVYRFDPVRLALSRPSFADHHPPVGGRDVAPPDAVLGAQHPPGANKRTRAVKGFSSVDQPCQTGASTELHLTTENVGIFPSFDLSLLPDRSTLLPPCCLLASTHALCRAPRARRARIQGVPQVGRMSILSSGVLGNSLNLVNVGQRLSVAGKVGRIPIRRPMDDNRMLGPR